VAGNAINSEAMNYVLGIPFFVAYALYRKRRMHQAVTPLENPKAIRNTEAVVGFFLLLTAFILYWHRSYTFYPVEYHLLSMPIFHRSNSAHLQLANTKAAHLSSCSTSLLGTLPATVSEYDRLSNLYIKLHSSV